MCTGQGTSPKSGILALGDVFPVERPALREHG
jgi:hypothetical protein